MIKNVRILCLLSRIWKLLKGNKGIKIKAKNRLILGVTKEIEKLELSEEDRFLLNNLIASANGWRSPKNPTLFGPFRIWI